MPVKCFIISPRIRGEHKKMFELPQPSYNMTLEVLGHHFLVRLVSQFHHYFSRGFSYVSSSKRKCTIFLMVATTSRVVIHTPEFSLWNPKLGGLGRCFSFSKGIFRFQPLVFGGVSHPYAPIPCASGLGMGFGYLNTF